MFEEWISANMNWLLFGLSGVLVFAYAVLFLKSKQPLRKSLSASDFECREESTYGEVNHTSSSRNDIADILLKKNLEILAIRKSSTKRTPHGQHVVVFRSGKAKQRQEEGEHKRTSTRLTSLNRLVEKKS